jgi:hypothetical protein
MHRNNRSRRHTLGVFAENVAVKFVESLAAGPPQLLVVDMRGGKTSSWNSTEKSIPVSWRRSLSSFGNVEVAWSSVFFVGNAHHGERVAR